MIVNEPLESLYFNWLCGKVMKFENPTPSLTYWNLLKILHDTEFVWLLSGDDNRAEDGLELRVQFLIAGDIPDFPEWRTTPCGLLEMLIAFARRAEFQSDIPAKVWFWEFIENLGLIECNDAADLDRDVIDDILQRFIWRTYNSNGNGGLFPIEHPKHDQTKVQLWYQFFDYLTDQNRLV